MITKQNIFRLAFWVVLTRILDGISTYLASPDLKREQNIIIKHFDLSWGFVLLLGFLFVCFTLWFMVYGYKNQNLFKTNSSSFKEYISIFFFGRKLSIIDALVSIPKGKNTLVFTSLVFPICLIYYSLFLTISNIFIFLTDISNTFWELYIDMHFLFKSLHIFVLIFLILFFSYRLLKKQYIHYHANPETQVVLEQEQSNSAATLIN